MIDLPSALFGFAVGLLCMFIALSTSYDPGKDA